jgi:tRNA-Thr(GGU) m(6)t(6)A37 methyltransferase TsaA
MRSKCSGRNPIPSLGRAACSERPATEMKPFATKGRKIEGKRAEGMKASRAAQLRPIGVIRSSLRERSKAPKQGSEGAPDAWLEVHPFATQALNGLAVGDEIIVLTWLHQAHREVLKVHPRSDSNRPLTGVFATRSPDRPNPIGLHQVTVRNIGKTRLRIGPMEAIDGTPVIDIKPVLCEIQKR